MLDVKSTATAATQTKSVAELQRVTGLKMCYAEACFTKLGGYAPALASFAQSFCDIPADYFDDAEVATRNARLINEELHLIYEKARRLKTQPDESDAAVWRRFYDAEAVGATATRPSVFGTSAHSTAETKPSTSILPAPAGASVFGFGTALPATQSSLPNGGGAAGTRASPFGATIGASAVMPAAGFGFGDVGRTQSATTPSSAAAPATAAEPKPAKAKLKYCSPTHFTGPYFEMPTFWDDEVVARAPLLNLDYGFLEANRATLRKRLLGWVEKAKFYKHPVKYVEIEDEDEEVVRVIIKDADRTFFAPVHRTKLVALLHAMYHEFGAYGQAMSYLAGLCMLVLNEEESAAVIRFVATEYIKGHWAAEAVGFATSAWVVEYFMQKRMPDVTAHLQSLNLWPDTYLQKILTGLCIHVLRFNELFEFLDAFMQGGLPYLIRFCLAIVEHFRSDLLAVRSTQEASSVYEIMRLDSHVADQHDIRQILDRVGAIDLGEEAQSIDLIRSKVYGEKVEPRLKRAPKTETYEPCAVCQTNRPTWWCDDLGAVCDSCKAKNDTMAFEKY